MTPRDQEEYSALRATIRERGTARVWIFVAGIAVWAALTTAALALLLPPVATLVPLVTLWATFEAIVALHVGVERVGRYLLAFHADQWEQTAGAFGRPPRAISVDALFTAPFLVAAAVNLVPLMTTAPIVQELVAVVGAHAVFAARVLAMRTAAGRQRTVDLDRFTQLANERPPRDTHA